MDLRNIRRINVIGTSGSGKSTFSRRLAKALALPCIEMDAVYWGRDWHEPADSEFLPKVAAIVAQSDWVLDGNYSRTNAIKFRRAQLVVWLDMSFARTMYRVTKRSFQRAWTREEIWENTGNRESFAKAIFSPKSPIRWALANYQRNRRRYATLGDNPEFSELKLVRLRTPREVATFLDEAEALRL